MLTDILPLIFSADLDRSVAFYRDVLGLETAFGNSWFVQFRAPGQPKAQIAMMTRDHFSIPEALRQQPAGVAITVETDDVDAVHRSADLSDAQVVVPLTDEVWGQRHFVLVDPDGLMVDVVQQIQPDPDFVASGGME